MKQPFSKTFICSFQQLETENMKMLASIMLLGFACLFLKIESVTSAPMADADPQNVFIFPGGFALH